MHKLWSVCFTWLQYTTMSNYLASIAKTCWNLLIKFGFQTKTMQIRRLRFKEFMVIKKNEHGLHRKFYVDLSITRLMLSVAFFIWRDHIPLKIMDRKKDRFMPKTQRIRGMKSFFLCGYQWQKKVTLNHQLVCLIRSIHIVRRPICGWCNTPCRHLSCEQW